MVSRKNSLELKDYCNSPSGKRTIVRALNKGLSLLKVYSLLESIVKDYGELVHKYTCSMKSSSIPKCVRLNNSQLYSMVYGTAKPIYKIHHAAHCVIVPTLRSNPKVLRIKLVEK